MLLKNFRLQSFFLISDISWVDLTARSLMQKLHDELDYDDDGNVSRDEGAEV